MLLGVGVIVLYLINNSNENLIPSALGNLKLVEQYSGQQAQKIVNHLHGKGVTPERTFIGIYQGDESEATLYLSLFRDSSEAAKAERTMVNRIRNGNPVFGHYQELAIEGKQISFCLGQGHAHYFFSWRERVYWLEVDPMNAQNTLNGLFKILQH